jgi:SAM-dependent methyltransferase
VFSRSAHLYDAVYSFKDYAAEAEQVHAVIQAHAPGAATLLDVACGTGKHLEHLARWYRVEGVDLDEEMLAIAGERLGDLTLHTGDMVSFDLGRTFDAVTCLFSSIGYVGSVERLNRAIASMAAHLAPGGVLVVEPWFSPEVWEVGRPRMITVDEPDLKVARVNVSRVEGRMSILDFTYLVATSEGVEVLEERHEAILLTDEEYRDAFVAAGLAVEHDAQGLNGRGLYVGVTPSA